MTREKKDLGAVPAPDMEASILAALGRIEEKMRMILVQKQDASPEAAKRYLQHKAAAEAAGQAIPTQRVSSVQVRGLRMARAGSGGGHKR